jgi:hypothetical protein
VSRRGVGLVDSYSPLFDSMADEVMSRCRAADYLRWADLCRFIEEVFVTRLGCFPTGQQFASIEREVDARRHEESFIWRSSPLPFPSREWFVVNRDSTGMLETPIVVWLSGAFPDPRPLGAGTPFYVREDTSPAQDNAIRAMEGD